jgi:hypothetical protein
VSRDRRLQPPSGSPPPTSAELPDGTPLQLLPLAEEVCRRYRQEFPDEEQRYGDAGIAWCVHDNQHLFNWAVLELGGHANLTGEVSWLAKVLQARDFPVDRLARNLDIGAAVVLERVARPVSVQLATMLSDAAGHVRARGDFLS